MVILLMQLIRLIIQHVIGCLENKHDYVLKIISNISINIVYLKKNILTFQFIYYMFPLRTKL